jgi:hypothetical protein
MQLSPSAAELLDLRGTTAKGHRGWPFAELTQQQWRGQTRRPWLRR